MKYIDSAGVVRGYVSQDIFLFEIRIDSLNCRYTIGIYSVIRSSQSEKDFIGESLMPMIAPNVQQTVP
jgi:hypothetical protein